jgi:hypothetical protein
MDLETLVLPLKTEDNGFRAGIARVTQITSALIDTFSKTIQESTKLASDFAETTSKVGVVFDDMADGMMSWAKTSATAMGMSKNQALSAAATFGNLFRAMKIGTKDSADMSKGLVELASDLASFNNMDPTDVLEKLRAGLAGETEPLRTLGVNLNEAVLKQKAFEMGLSDGKSTLDAATKAQAAYALIMEQTALAQGDFARTSEGLANQQRILEAQWEDLKTTLGAVFLPVFTKATKAVNEFVSKIATAMASGDWGQVKAIILQQLGVLDQAISTWLDGLDWTSAGTRFGAWLDKVIQDGVSKSDVPASLQSLGKGIADFIAASLGVNQMGGWDAYWQAWVDGDTRWRELLESSRNNIGAWQVSVNNSLAAWAANTKNIVVNTLSDLAANTKSKLMESASAFAKWAVSDVPAALSNFGSTVVSLMSSALNDLYITTQNKLTDIAKEFNRRGLGWALQLIKGFESGVGALLDFISSLVQEINSILKKIITDFKITIKMPTFGGGGDNQTVTTGTPGTGHGTTNKAAGGTVLAGHAYNWNEMGRKEFFVPATNGIIDNRMSLGQQTVTIANWNDMDYSRLATEIVKATNNV